MMSAALADQDGIGEAESANAAGDLGDLGRAMGPRVTRIRNQAIQRPVFDLQSMRGDSAVRCFDPSFGFLSCLTRSLRYPSPYRISRRFSNAPSLI